MAANNFKGIPLRQSLTPTETPNLLSPDLLALWALGEAIYERRLATLTKAVTTAEKSDHHV